MANSRLMINIKGISAYALPRKLFQNRLSRVFDEILRLDDGALGRIKDRLNYYNQISQDFSGLFKGSESGENAENSANLQSKNAQSVQNSHIKHLLARKTYNEREEKAKQILSENVGAECALCVNSCPVEGALVFENSNENLGENSQNLSENSVNFAENSRTKDENSPNLNSSKNSAQNSNLNSRKIVVVKESCVGCGVCEEVCFAGVIEILPQVSYEEFYENSQENSQNERKI